MNIYMIFISSHDCHFSCLFFTSVAIGYITQSLLNEPCHGQPLVCIIMASLQKQPSVEYSQPPPVREITIVFIGRTRAGKSTLRLNILHGGEWQVLSPGSATLFKATCQHGHVALKVYDTEGLEPDNLLESLSGDIKGQADLVILCIPVTPGAVLEDQTPDIMRKLQEVFSKAIWRRCIIALTFSNVAWERCRKKSRAPMEEYKTYITSYSSRIQEEFNKMGVSDVLVTTPFSQQLTDEHKFQVVAIPVGDEADDNVLPGVQSKAWRDLFFLQMVRKCPKEIQEDLQNFKKEVGMAATIRHWVYGGLPVAMYTYMAGIALGSRSVRMAGLAIGVPLLANFFVAILFKLKFI